MIFGCDERQATRCAAPAAALRGTAGTVAIRVGVRQLPEVNVPVRHHTVLQQTDEMVHAQRVVAQASRTGLQRAARVDKLDDQEAQDLATDGSQTHPR